MFFLVNAWWSNALSCQHAINETYYLKQEDIVEVAKKYYPSTCCKHVFPVVTVTY